MFTVDLVSDQREGVIKGGRKIRKKAGKKGSREKDKESRNREGEERKERRVLYTSLLLQDGIHGNHTHCSRQGKVHTQ